MAPHPLVRGLADPAFELPVDLCGNPSHVVAQIGRSGHSKLLDLDSEKAVRAYAQAARHPHSGAESARHDGGDPIDGIIKDAQDFFFGRDGKAPRNRHLHGQPQWILDEMDALWADRLAKIEAEKAKA